MRRLINSVISNYYDANGSNGFVDPSIFFKQMADGQTKTENRHKDRDWYHLRMLVSQVFCKLIHTLIPRHFCHLSQLSPHY